MRKEVLKNRREIRRKKMIRQRLMGIAMLLICILIMVFALNGQTSEDSDVTPVLLIAPMGVCLLFAKKCWLY